MMHTVLQESLPDFELYTMAIHSAPTARLSRMMVRLVTSDVREAQEELQFRDSFLSSVQIGQVLEKADWKISNEKEIGVVLQLAQESFDSR